MPERRTLTEAEREASGWIVRIKAHDVSEAERQAFANWLNADPANAAAYAKLERTWGVVASLQHLKGRVPANDASPRPAGLRAGAFGMAASALLAIGALAWFTQQQNTHTAGAQHIETAPGELRTITLPDNSTIQLSPGSEVAIKITERERRVDLNAGFALFDVAHDAGRPFVVHTPRGDIRDLGTSFVIRVSDAEVRTTVLHGRVSGATEQRGLFSALSPQQTVTAEANQEILLNDQGARVVPIAAESIPRRLAWRQHMLAFDNEPLSQAIAEVSQQTGWTFELADPALGDEHVGGYVRADPEAFIDLMSTGLNLEARQNGPHHVVLSRR